MSAHHLSSHNKTTKNHFICPLSKPIFPSQSLQLNWFHAQLIVISIAYIVQFIFDIWNLIMIGHNAQLIVKLKKLMPSTKKRFEFICIWIGMNLSYIFFYVRCLLETTWAAKLKPFDAIDLIELSATQVINKESREEIKKKTAIQHTAYNTLQSKEWQDSFLKEKPGKSA